LGPHDGQQHFGVQISQKLSNMAFYRHTRASVNGFEMNDIIEDGRHWCRLLATTGRAAYTIYSILGITAASCFPMINGSAFKHNVP